MMLKSDILSGNTRLDGAASGGPSVKMKPPLDDPDAVKRIQNGLVALGFRMPLSFPNGASGEPDGIFGNETYQTVLAFQRREFPKQPDQWDGHVGQFTLGRMDDLLGGSGDESVILPNELTMSNCRMLVLANVA
jgi:peptidoglycan hydrolase-like protein with peptidoglycan-binding domain